MFLIEKKKDNQQYIINLINTYRMTIRKVLSYRLHSPNTQDLEDCEQEVYLVISKEIEKLIKHPHIEGWICICCRNIATNYNSKIIAKRNRTTEFDDLPDRISIEDIVINQIIYNNAIQNRALETIILSLSDKEKLLYTLRGLDRLSINQIAEQLNITISATKNRLSRLHRKILNMVKEYT